MFLVLPLGATEEYDCLFYALPSHVHTLLLGTPAFGLVPIYMEGRMIILLVVLVAELYFNLEDLLFLGKSRRNNNEKNLGYFSLWEV